MGDKYKCTCPDCKGSCNRLQCPWCLKMRSSSTAKCTCGYGHKPIAYVAQTGYEYPRPVPMWERAEPRLPIGDDIEDDLLDE